MTLEMEVGVNPLDRGDVRLAVLDIEASALHPKSFPMEVGVAIIQGAAAPVRIWSELIRPTDEWLSDGHWSPASQAIHGLSRDTIVELGVPAAEVAGRLNTLLRGTFAVFSDAPMYDQAWLDRLFAAAGCEQGFVMYDIERLAGYLRRDEYRQFVHLLSRSRIPHRAAADASRLASAILEARIGYPPPVLDAELER